MASFSIKLGSAATLVKLFSYPNQAGSTESLADTILHWVTQMLARDGFAARGGVASVQVDGAKYVLNLDGPREMEAYTERLPRFLKNGADALKVVTDIKSPGKGKKTDWPAWLKKMHPQLKPRLWDPLDTGNWRYFLPLGMAMINQKIVNFFHYPPLRLLDPMRDYLDDPVPVRLIELMKANGIKTDEEAWLYSTVMDGAPIAAPDDAGTIYQPDTFKNPAHLLPIECFTEYQKAQTTLLLNTSPVADGYTVPIVVYGTPARDAFNTIWKKAKLSTKTPTNRVEVVKGKQTPVLCSGHPYAFFAQVQTEVGAGEMKPEAWPNGVRTMSHDLAVIRWQIAMAKNPKANPATEWKSCLAYWNDPVRLDTVYKLVLHQGSLWYPDPTSLKFTFRLSLDDVAQRAAAAATSVRKATNTATAKRKQ